MASKFCESPHSRCRGLQTSPHLHLGESRQGGLERETGAVCVVIGFPGDGIGRPATRAKALNYIPERSRGLANPLPRTKVRGWHKEPTIVVGSPVLFPDRNYFKQSFTCLLAYTLPRTKVRGWHKEPTIVG